MNAVNVKQIARQPRPLELQDSLGKAAELLRLSNFSVAPVVIAGRVVGLVSERDLSVGLRNGHNGGSPGSMPRIESVMSHSVEVIQQSSHLDDVAEHFERSRWDALPVVDEFGCYYGMVSRSDVVAALCGSIRPPIVGGMATPLGVLLTTGHVRGGASNFALMLTGMFLASIFLGVDFITRALFVWLSPHLAEIAGSWQIATFEREGILALIISVVDALAFLLLIRLMPLSGYHGAEHKVVHAIERGEDLTPENVRPMPRPHPRCGTNLMVFFVIVTGLWGRIDSALALILGVLGWKFLGMKVQQVFTTREPTDKQLLAGILAGKELLERYNAHPSHRVGLARRLWNMGFPQVLFGFSVVTAIQSALVWYVRHAIGS